MTDHDTELAIATLGKLQEDTVKFSLTDAARYVTIHNYSQVVKAFAQALHSVRKEENDACAKVAETTFCSTKYDGVVVEIATAIRNRMKEKS